MDELMSMPRPLKLSNATLDNLPPQIARPRYDRSRLTPGIVHIGLGNFHRAHQAWYLHRLMQEGRAQDWAILGAGVRPYDAAMREKLLGQDCLTALIELAPDSRAAEVTGAMIDYLPVEEGNGALIRAMADPVIRIVSLTVTEGGYHIDAVTGGLDAHHLDIVHDAAHPDRPRTAFGAIVAALRLRRAAGHPPFPAFHQPVLRQPARQRGRSAPDGGRAGTAERSGPRGLDRGEGRLSQLNGGQHRARDRASRTRPRARDGHRRRRPVTHENFRQWVIQDDFCAGRPDWDRVGATFTPDVHAHEMMKIRILNAGHQVLANAGELLSVPSIADCMAHPAIFAMFRKVQVEEILPFVNPVPGMTPAEYLALIERRFSNPAIGDTTRRVAFDGSSRHPGFLMPVIREAVAAGTKVEGLALVEALWARMCAGHSEDGARIDPNDPNWTQLTAAAQAAKARPRAWLEQSGLYGPLTDAAPFADAFERWLIWRDGTAAALATYADAC